jgi:phosphate transport system substrate-binding protein
MRRSNSAIAGILSSVSLIGCLTVSTPSQAGETIRIGGTGSGLAAMRMLGAEFQKRNPGTELEVLASLGTLGGIEALGEGDRCRAGGTRAEAGRIRQGCSGSSLHDYGAGLRR